MPLYGEKDVVDDQKSQTDGEEIGHGGSQDSRCVGAVKRVGHQTEDMKATPGDHRGIKPDRPFLRGVHPGDQHQSDQSGVPFRTVGKGCSHPVEWVGLVIRGTC